MYDARRSAPAYVFSDRARNRWEPPLRRLVLARLGPRRRRWLAVKEPHGSDAADLILSVLPRSPMIFLLRDGRDVVDSELDAASEGSWALQAVAGHQPVANRLDFVEQRARAWLRRTEIVERAFESHPPQLRRLVRYEQLRADPAAVLPPLATWLEIDPAPLLEAARATAFERLERTGPGEFVRSARPGAWRDNLNEKEQAALVAILGEKLATLGYRDEAPVGG